MAQSENTGEGKDQRGFEYTVTYDPEWFKSLRVTRSDPGTGRRTTVTVVKNPNKTRKKKNAPARATTKVKSNEGPEFTLDVKGTVKSVKLEYVLPAKSGKGNGKPGGEVVIMSVDDDQPPPPPTPGGGG